MEIPGEHRELFNFWRFSFPIIDALRAGCFPALMSVVQTTALSGVGVADGESCERLRPHLESHVSFSIPPGVIQPAMTVAELCDLLATYAPEATEADVQGFFEEFPGLRA